MNESQCSRLDAYLAHELEKEEETEFTSHLSQCDLCRCEVNRQAHLDALLKQAVDQEPVPTSLLQPIRHEVPSSIWFPRVRWTVATAASLLIVGLCVGLVSRVSREESASALARVEKKFEQPPPRERPAPARVTITPQSNLVAVPVPSTSQNVTIYWIYPTLSPSSASQEEVILTNPVERSSQ